MNSGRRKADLCGENQTFIKYMNISSIIEIDNLSVRLGGKPVLSGFSLKVEPSEKVMITGRSGSGKTTLLRCI